MRSNLPPGVRLNMIPGNRPEDEREEEFWLVLDQLFLDKYGEEAADPVFKLFNEPGPLQDLLNDYVRIGRDIAYDAGRADQRSDDDLEKAMSDEGGDHPC